MIRRHRAFFLLMAILASGCSEGVPKFGLLDPGKGRNVHVNHGHFKISPASGAATSTNFKLRGRVTQRNTERASSTNFKLNHVSQ